MTHSTTISRLVHEHRRWSNVSKFMKLRIAQVWAAIPVIGYLLLWSDRIQAYLALHPQLAGIQFLTTVTRLTLVYIGSLMILSAWLLYQLGCPKIVKRHPDAEDYVKESLSIQDMHAFAAIAALVGTFTTRETPTSDAIFRKEAPRAVSTWFRDAATVHDAAIHHSGPDRKGVVYRAYYLAQEQQHAAVLNTCMILIGLGSIMILLPSVEVAFLVLAKLLSFFFLSSVQTFVKMLVAALRWHATLRRVLAPPG